MKKQLNPSQPKTCAELNLAATTGASIVIEDAVMYMPPTDDPNGYVVIEDIMIQVAGSTASSSAG